MLIHSDPLEHEHDYRTTTSRVFRVAGQFGLKTKPCQEIEFFFYAKTQDDASNLAIELNRLGYHVGWVDQSSGDKDMWLVSGCTQPMDMDEESVVEWSEQMCRLAEEHDCLFDGWGTLVEGDGSKFDNEVRLI